MTAHVALALLAAVAVIAIVVAAVAIVQARTARAALRAYQADQRESIPGAQRTPATSRAVTEAAEATRPVPPPTVPRPAIPVLVVEDEPGVRELITRVLVRDGRQVIAVAGPHEALAALHRQPAIALMLVDVVMPEMDGYDLAAEARALSPGIHVVFMSAFARDLVRHPPGDSFLPKPFTTESLTRIVDDALILPAT